MKYHIKGEIITDLKSYKCGHVLAHYLETTQIFGNFTIKALKNSLHFNLIY